ncbi:heme exporter protein A [Desulfitispora alkaliphila]|uniref:ABC transporter ATP-binding protein n=1 Tax=Desulfitispora alkaliphila TaxID=622674 RepID=UPI003D1D92DA
MIRAEGISKKIGSREILKGIDLNLEPGQFVTVLGPNGAGKTTLLKVLSLLSKPSSGKLYIGGTAVEDNIAQMRQKIGVISHNTFLYDRLTAYENLRFYGEMYNVSNLRQRIYEVIEEVGLEYVMADPVGTFSRGMQQRLSIARAIIHNPQVLFLDEPYTGLDQHAIGILNKVLYSLHGEERTIFMITHNYEQGLELSDKVVILVNGSIVYQEEPDSLSGDQFKKIYLEQVGGQW